MSSIIDLIESVSIASAVYRETLATLLKALGESKPDDTATAAALELAAELEKAGPALADTGKAIREYTTAQAKKSSDLN